MPTAQKINLEFENHVKGNRIMRDDFARQFAKGLKILEREKRLKKAGKGGVVQLTMLNDATIKKLNKEYRGKNKPTDVLSFSYIEENAQMNADGSPFAFPQQDLIGEIAISIETARNQAKEHGKTLKEELQFLFVHGLFHVFGYDHEEENERKEMFDLQDEVIGNKSWRKIIG